MPTGTALREGLYCSSHVAWPPVSPQPISRSIKNQRNWRLYISTWIYAPLPHATNPPLLSEAQPTLLGQHIKVMAHLQLWIKAPPGGNTPIECYVKSSNLTDKKLNNCAPSYILFHCWLNPLPPIPTQKPLARITPTATDRHTAACILNNPKISFEVKYTNQKKKYVCTVCSSEFGFSEGRKKKNFRVLRNRKFDRGTTVTRFLIERRPGLSLQGMVHDTVYS